MEPRGQEPEDLVVEQTGRAEDLEGSDLVGADVLEEPGEDLRLGHGRAAGGRVGLLVGVDGQVEVERQAGARLGDGVPMGRVGDATGFEQVEAGGHR